MTTQRSLLITFLIILLLTNSAYCASITWDVHLTDGRIYKDVVIKADRTSRILTITSMPEAESISFDSVACILDKNGTDITRYLIRRDSKPVFEQTHFVIADTLDNSQTMESSQKEHVTANAEFGSRDELTHKTNPRVTHNKHREWSIAFRLHGNYSTPIGDYYSKVNTGLDMGFGVSVAVSRRIAIRFDIARSGLEQEESVHPEVIDPAWEVIEQNYQMTTNRYSLGIQRTSQASNPRTIFGMSYVSLGLGLRTEDKRNTVIARIASDSTRTITDHTKNTKFMACAGGALVFGLTETLGIEIGVNLDLVFLGRDQNDYSKYASVLDFRFGLIAVL